MRGLNFLDRWGATVYALLRIVSGFMFAFHGAQKLFGLFAQIHLPIGSQAWFAGVIEFVGGLAIMLGLKTRLAAFLCSGEMAVAYLQFHWRGRFGAQFFPPVNQGELAVLYAFLFLFIATQGAGQWSLDRRR